MNLLFEASPAAAVVEPMVFMELGTERADPAAPLLAECGQRFRWNARPSILRRNLRLPARTYGPRRTQSSISNCRKASPRAQRGDACLRELHESAREVLRLR